MTELERHPCEQPLCQFNDGQVEQFVTLHRLLRPIVQTDQLKEAREQLAETGASIDLMKWCYGNCQDFRQRVDTTITRRIREHPPIKEALIAAKKMKRRRKWANQ